MNIIDNKTFSFCKNKSGIYLLQCNNHYYIGSSKNIYTRIRDHKKILIKNRHYNKFMQRCYNKYGLNNFYLSILEFCDEESLLTREQYHINFHKPNINGVTDVVRNIVDPDKRSNQKPVYCYDLEGNYLKKYINNTYAANYLAIPKHKISNAANPNNIVKKAGLYQWSYTKYTNLTKYINNSHTHKNKIVSIYDLSGDKIKTFDSISDAAKYISEPNWDFTSVCATISSATKSPGAYTIKNKYFASTSTDQKLILQRKRNLPLYSINKITNLITNYNSVTEAATALNTKNSCITRVINKKLICKGCYWKR